MRPLPGPQQFRSCLVCSANTPNAHLGVDACRACATFFRRASASKRVYICRQGNGKCHVSKDLSFICRKCRLDKCTAIGMDLDAAVGGSCSLGASRGNAEPQPSTSSSSPSVHSEQDETTLLERIAKEFVKYCERRKRSELHMLSTGSYPMETVHSQQTGEDYFIATVEFEDAITPVAASDFISFLRAAFPEYADLSLHEQRAIFKAGFWNFLLLESHYFNFKRFAYSNRHHCAGHMTVYDWDNPAGFISNSVPIQLRKDIVSQMTYYQRRVVGIAQPSLKKATLSEIEYIVLFALLIWNCESEDPRPITVAELGDSITKQLIADLGARYKADGRECSMRIGEIISIVHTIEESRLLVKENLALFELLNMWKKDNAYVIKTIS